MSRALHSVPCKDVDTRERASTYLVSIAGSAGAFESLCRILTDFREGLDVALIVMMHTGPGSVLAEVLHSRSRLPVRTATSGDLLQAGVVYVAQPGSHLIVNPDARLTVSATPKRRLFRPSADWLFESASASFGARHVAVVLSGMLSDGAASLSAVKRLGGTVIVQSPGDTPFPEMPLAAIDTGHADHIVRIGQVADTIWNIFEGRDAVTDRASWEAPFAAQAVA